MIKRVQQTYPSGSRLRISRDIPKKEYQQKTKISSKILLIIDNAPHLSSELIEHENGLHKLKKRYRKELLQRIGLSDADGDNMVSQHGSINLKDCSYITVQVWNSISGSPSSVS
ncbi:hypothetical protein T09_8360 [Trichinella sp. T9]|nr:hypothetical protein T09_8360 [Trichinella sp. T9]